MIMDIDQIARVVKLVESSRLHEVTIADNGQSMKVVNNLGLPSRVATVKSVDSADTIVTTDVAQTDRKTLQVCAIYVGHVYLSQDDATDDLVKEGDQIQKGQTICFIDELTRLLPVISDKDGVIGAILVENGQAIEYGQPILEVKATF
jgi:acetyl-CoA carboxylase biotin carboxyl carrier protein